MAESRLLFVHVPSLIAILLHAERKKGSPLSEQEVLSIRDNGQCIAMLPYAARAVAEARGYDDIDPEYAWEPWLEVRKQHQLPKG